MNNPFGNNINNINNINNTNNTNNNNSSPFWQRAASDDARVQTNSFSFANKLGSPSSFGATQMNNSNSNNNNNNNPFQSDRQNHGGQTQMFGVSSGFATFGAQSGTTTNRNNDGDAFNGVAAATATGFVGFSGFGNVSGGFPTPSLNVLTKSPFSGQAKDPFSTQPSPSPFGGSGGASMNTSGLFGAPAQKQSLNVNASPFAPSPITGTATGSSFGTAGFNSGGGGGGFPAPVDTMAAVAASKINDVNNSTRVFGGSPFGGMSGFGANDGGVKTTTTTSSGFQIPAPRVATGFANAFANIQGVGVGVGGGGGGSSASEKKPSPFAAIRTTPPKQAQATFGNTTTNNTIVADDANDFDDLRATSLKHITGTCDEMCPKSEVQRRSDEGDLEIFERVDESNRNKTSIDLCCKKYTRIVDGVQPDMVRTKTGLAKTMSHLWRILDERQEEFVVKSKFLWDRLRSVRQDLSLQQMYDAFAASALQQMVRYAIISEHELCEDAATAISPDGHNSHLNVEQLTKTLTTLRHIYDDHRAKKQPLPLDHEAEMFALQLLLRIDAHGRYSVSTHEMLGDLRSARNAILNHPAVNFALACRSAYIDVNCAKFFKLVEKANYIEKCVLHKYFVKIRSRTLERFNGSMAKGAFPIKELARIFRASEMETELMCLHHGLNVLQNQEDGKCVEFRTTTFSHPSEDFETKRSPLVKTNNDNKFRQFIVRNDEIATTGEQFTIAGSFPASNAAILQQQSPELTAKQKEAQELRERIQKVEAEQKRAKAEIEAKQAEKARFALEAKQQEEEKRAEAERERIEKERMEKERLEHEKRLKQEEEEKKIRIEKEREEKERAEKERAARKHEQDIRELEEKLERDRKEKLELERQEKERLRLEAERAEKVRIEEERAKRLEAKRLAEIARKKAEEERKERERLEAVRIRRFKKNRKAILQLWLWRWRKRKDESVALKKKQKALSMMSTSPSTLSSPSGLKQKTPTNDLRNLLKKRNIEMSIPTTTRSERDEREEAHLRTLALRTVTLVDVSSAFARPLDLPKVLQSTRAFTADAAGSARRQTRIWKLVLCSGAEYEPPSVYNSARSPNAVAVAAWLRAKLSKSAIISSKSSEEGTVLASYASKLSMHEPFHWVIVKDVPGNTWTPSQRNSSRMQDEIHEKKYEEGIAGLSAGFFVLDCSSLFENPRTKGKEISRNEVHRLKQFASVVKHANAPLLVVAASSKDENVNSSQKLIEKAFRDADVPPTAFIMRIDNAFARFSLAASEEISSIDEKRHASFIEKIDLELENQVIRCGNSFAGVPNRVETSLAEALELEFSPVQTDFERKIFLNGKNADDDGQYLSMIDFKIVIDSFNEAVDNIKEKIILACDEDCDYWPFIELSNAYLNRDKSFFENVPDPLWRKDVPFLLEQLDRAKLPKIPFESLEFANAKNIFETLFEYVSSLEDSEFNGATRRHLQRSGFNCVRIALSLCESRKLAMHANTEDIKVYVRKEMFMNSLLSTKKNRMEIGSARKRDYSELFLSNFDDDDDDFQERRQSIVDVAIDDEEDIEDDDDDDDDDANKEANKIREMLRSELALSQRNALLNENVSKKRKSESDAVAIYKANLLAELNAENELRSSLFQQ